MHHCSVKLCRKTSLKQGMVVDFGKVVLYCVDQISTEKVVLIPTWVKGNTQSIPIIELTKK